MSFDHQILKFNGEFRIRNAENLQKELLSAESTSLVLDLSEVSDFDTAGVQLLLSLYKTVKQKGGRLGIVAASESVSRLLDFYRLKFDDLQ
ncbi:MAG: STAS domain-containing protein [Leptonema sp. (in: Bacteria)]|nr:STAS domain-containing protein [Leptonema sp. (in: bacteria)]